MNLIEDPSRIQRRINEVLHAEAPIHIGLLAKRGAFRWQLERVTRRAQERVQAVIKTIHHAVRPVERDGFVWEADQDPAQYRRFRVPDLADPSPRKAEELPPQEIAGAVKPFGLPTYSQFAAL